MNLIFIMKSFINHFIYNDILIKLFCYITLIIQYLMIEINDIRLI